MPSLPNAIPEKVSEKVKLFLRQNPLFRLAGKKQENKFDKNCTYLTRVCVMDSENDKIERKRMLKRLIILNSEIYSKADIELDNCNSLQIVGPNNIGKSTLIYALNFLFIIDGREMNFSGNRTGGKTIDVGSWEYKKGEPNTNIEGPVLETTIPDFNGKKMRLLLEVENHPDWNDWPGCWKSPEYDIL